ncbi:hypothetical protein K2173_014902 [Erythroxylum novogranatense]|uniref:BHLH domain-containing protein n=1 Tax=Erythroxylum novogranatense TaxID=1862640 RepID=A0AAV8TID9_9ROSI|nr:hypothetical protein K2173_014902 [Erythroxylum novogranatense]
MDLTQHSFLEELLQAPKMDTWTSFTSDTTEFFSGGWNLDSFHDTTSLATTNPSFFGFSSSTEPSFEYSFTDQTCPFVGSFSVPEIGTSYAKNDTSLCQAYEDYPSIAEDEEIGLLSNHSFEDGKHGCKVEVEQASNFLVPCGVKKNKSKKLEGQPSKNLMAERRRRKRLNDRLSMLRSIVPKISKMDRTSILGDTIDYMKELLERINKLQEEGDEEGSDQMNLLTNLKEQKPNEVLVKNSPKFHVERREIDTQVDICCAAKPGLLLSTVNTLEALGLEIEQCVISCFNDFSMQASCSEHPEQRTMISPEDIKQALFRTAGYGGRYL